MAFSPRPPRTEIKKPRAFSVSVLLHLLFDSGARASETATLNIDYFWERIAKQEGNHPPPEFLSTHPATQKRMEDIIGELPEALQYYNAFHL